jgi:NADPH:quinone reductase-like Zn-dependent oxidoreductase
LNPVRGELVHQAEDWVWSSFRAMVGLEACPPWLDGDWLVSQFGDGSYQPVIDSVFPLGWVADARRHMASNTQKGKIVVKV